VDDYLWEYLRKIYPCTFLILKLSSFS
jgi:hypothetical protein